MSNASHPAVRIAAMAALFASALASMPAHALYKVVGPDGKVTYTDRPPTTKDNKVQSVNTTTGGVSTAGLPYELRLTVEKYPVVLYSGSGCGPCDSARQALRQRGVPFSERTVASAEDNAALQKLTGKKELPAVTIGSQLILGYNAAELTTYIDAAGYPKTSALPSNYNAPTAQPLTTARPDESQAPAPSPAPEAAPTAAPAAPSGFKF